jgi:hypothetical protein
LFPAGYSSPGLHLPFGFGSIRVWVPTETLSLFSTLPYHSVANVPLNCPSVLGVRPAYDDDVSGFLLSSPYQAIVFQSGERDEAMPLHSPNHTAFPVSGVTFRSPIWADV